jgi:hypothetical protein
VVRPSSSGSNAAAAGYRWQVWLFREESPEQRLKLAYGVLHDTAFRYAFTYNPWPVRLIAGFEHEHAVAAEDDRSRPLNARLQEARQSVQERMGAPGSEQVGWLRPESWSDLVAAHLADFGVRSIPLDRPKPPGYPPGGRQCGNGGDQDRTPAAPRRPLPAHLWRRGYHHDQPAGPCHIA